jgi:hypothetical protein
MLDVEKTIKLVGAIVTIGGLALGVANYLSTLRKDAETRNLEARKQFLTRQLELYTDATRTAAKLANLDTSSSDRPAVERRFWELYWGELSMVESREVEGAMKRMGDCLGGNCGGCPASDLRQCALALAHACRQSLAESWGVADWQY